MTVDKVKDALRIKFWTILEKHNWFYMLTENNAKKYARARKQEESFVEMAEKSETFKELFDRWDKWRSDKIKVHGSKLTVASAARLKRPKMPLSKAEEEV